MHRGFAVSGGVMQSHFRVFKISDMRIMKNISRNLFVSGLLFVVLADVCLPPRRSRRL